MTSVDYHARRERLFRNGHWSHETDILSKPGLRRKAFVKLEKERRIERFHRFFILAREFNQADKRMTSAVVIHLYPQPEPPLIRNHERPPTLRRIAQVTCRQFGIRMIELVSDRRTANVVIPRHVAMYLARELTAKSYPAISRAFGRNDHTTAIHAYNKIKAKIEADEKLASDIAAIRVALSPVPTAVPIEG